MWPFEVKVSIIEPGLFKTNIANVDNILNDINRNWDQLPPEDKNQYGEEIFEASRCTS